MHTSLAARTDYDVHSSELQTLSNMCKQGFDDTLRFLHRNNLLNCTRCLAVQSTFVLQRTIEESMEYDPECIECKLHRQVRI
jgi:arginyl-tRNA--protein-N-Asp/Glu arginylyltransferase